MATDLRTPAPRALRASVGLSVLAAVLLACGGVVELTDDVFGSPVNGGGGGSHPATPARVHPTTPEVSSPAATPSASCSPSASSTEPSEPTSTATTPASSPEHSPTKVPSGTRTSTRRPANREGG